MRSLLAVLVLALLVPAAPAVAHRAPGSSHSNDAALARAEADQANARVVPSLRVTRQVRGLDKPWDAQPIGDGRLLITQRDLARLTVWKDGAKHRVQFPSEQVWVSGETGLMSLEVDPNVAQTGRFYTCQGGYLSGGGHDVRVIAWRLNDSATRATMVEKLIGGFPTSSGRHGGCRLLIARNGSLIVGTGDAAQGTNPRNLRSLGGKTLRLDRMTGAPWPTNPFINSADRRKRYVHTYGHRNVQGLGQRADGTLWSIEQGTYRDDEVNRLVNGGDYGWDPGPGYDESVPMTDQSLPGPQINARWSSGDPTLATSGGTWVNGARWGALDDTFAVAALKASRVVFLKFDASGKLLRVRTPDALRHYGRLRSITQLRGGDLLVTTDNGGGADVVLRVHPR